MSRTIAMPPAATPVRRPGRLAGLAALHRYELDVPDGERRRLAAAWLLLAIVALLASGLYSLLLVAARAPFLAPLLPVADFFHVALVVHVDLSVLVWFVGFAGLLWTLSSTRRLLDLAWVAFVLAAIGAAIMAAAPFAGAGRPVMANYVPVLDEPVFMFGLTVFGIAFAATSLRALAAPEKVGLDLAPAGALRFGLNAAAVAAALALVALAWSWAGVPRGLAGKPYYELLFWGPGHVLQFTWTLMMLAAWLWLASASGAPVPLSPRVAVLLFGVGLVTVFTTPLIYLAWDVSSVEHQRLFTWQMRFGGGLAILPLALAVAAGVWRAGPAAEPAARPLRAALLASLLLFAAGGVIGFAIRGSDVRIPAHYHGAIVGITLAMMGLAYALMPRLGLGRPHPRLATWQAWLYGSGQLLHIVGLVWSGGYGVQRKVAGAAQVLRTPQEVAGMSLMGLGGLVAVAGGVLFLVVVWKAIRDRRKP
ncbi:MAG: cbb3-type cytochrome c oxidase subunit I [Burkholderiales bacterium]|nr:cbb3-type cytochrome c oxidase subunit I [Burkholderiales bacterium]